MDEIMKFLSESLWINKHRWTYVKYQGDGYIQVKPCFHLTMSPGNHCLAVVNKDTGGGYSLSLD